MALKGTWVDKIDGVSTVSAEDINSVAKAVIDLEDTAVTEDMFPPSLVETVNGKTGNVKLDASDVASASKEEVRDISDTNNERWNRLTKTTYNLYDKYNADIQPFYIRTSDKLITQQSYSRAVVIKRTSVIGEIVLFNCFKSASELGVKDMALYMCSEYPQVGGHALAYDKSYVESAYGRGKPNVTVDCEYLVLQFVWETNTTNSNTNELLAQMIEKLVVVCGSDVGDYDDYPYVDKEILKVEEENLSDEIKEKLQGSSPTVNYVETKVVHLGDNVIGSASLGEGWTASDGVYTHTTGYDADLIFDTAVEEGSVYILEFDTSYTADEFVRIGIGSQYRVLCYQGKSHITVPLMAVGGSTLYITPIKANYSGEISNITLRKIQDSGTELVLELYSTFTENHTQNYGFWNTFIGENVAENAVGSTRSIGIGYYTLNALQGGHRNIGIGTFAMSQLIGGEENISIGADSMLAVKNATACITIGMGGMQEGASREGDISIGKYTLRGTSASQTEKNIAIGESAGYSVTTAKRNIFIGNNSGYKNTSGFCNTYVGEGAGKAVTTGYFNTFIGRETNAPESARNVIAVGDNAKATKNNQAVIGSDAITETLLKGDLVVRGTDGVYRQIVFNEDGTCSWVAVS